MSTITLECHCYSAMFAFACQFLTLKKATILTDCDWDANGTLLGFQNSLSSRCHLYLNTLSARPWLACSQLYWGRLDFHPNRTVENQYLELLTPFFFNDSPSLSAQSGSVRLSVHPSSFKRPLRSKDAAILSNNSATHDRLLLIL